ncbi:MAG: VOC family protein [Phototrophicaceae bacterium]
MTVRIDHIVIHVQDLQNAISDYQSAGFTTNYGGQHADGITENALIIFADGSYIELIALVDGKSYDDAGFKKLLKQSGEGYTGYALQSDDLDADLAAMRERGVLVGDIREGSRQRPDGELLQWKMATIDDAMTPFIIQDISDRDLRVPLTPETITHANGATGIHELLIRVPSIESALNHFGWIVGTPLITRGVARFEMGTSAIVVTEVANASLIPYQLALYTDESEPKLVELTGARFLFI